MNRIGDLRSNQGSGGTFVEDAVFCLRSWAGLGPGTLWLGGGRGYPLLGGLALAWAGIRKEHGDMYWYWPRQKTEDEQASQTKTRLDIISSAICVMY